MLVLAEHGRHAHRATDDGDVVLGLLPEEIGRQERPPRSDSGRPGFEIPGGNRALVRSERLPVRLGERVGRARRASV
ncbi:hypothetical protein Amir_0383 [Actinosynnema mirum DSM 43827]|uniref:Uncharacterized protein n=2 Tax=Actinosynnema TaxID=40566 RepID=C6WGN4_ACTMD|nr:hypothetical protein Amir_0383 [Actinosynnema mirum DSM 43827]